ncbi:hypothetical protein [Modestobacter sp. KNN46-3]|jgi:choline dehydrogenase-like flavoprotein|uniref:hypothetical protein n=1 Tax=Modestobacter sp. KNN46-3 TaxID=2711218 RepID=UPI0013DFC386|nr:hypothetical protein [Modestobacter sp. KNN46-3]
METRRLVTEAVRAGAEEAMRDGAAIRPDCMVHRVNTDVRSGYRRDVLPARRRRQRPRRAAARADRHVSAYSIETPRLLLLSASSTRPDGLPTSSGLVGKGLMIEAGTFPASTSGDGSVFVTSGVSNPSLSIQAIAARTADQLIAAAAAGRRAEP